MITTLPENQLAYVGLVATLVTLLMNGVAALLELIPLMQENNAAYNWTLRAINGILSLAGVCVAELTLGTFDLHNWVAYIFAAGLAGGASHFVYVASTARKNAQLNNAYDHIALLNAKVPSAPVPDGKNSPVTPA